ncbi:NAD(P)-binding domain-containing protein [Pseudorhodoferax sp.]|uniref:NAD(P)-binding domain-containing protein n=1 Tax=Pseudorhodoferax sp. TaxID=1993553 RepID=UPI0039E2BD9B
MDEGVSQIERVERIEQMTEAQVVQAWLGRFEQALCARSAERIAALLADECHWRDLCAFTWSISPCDDKAAVVRQLLANQERVQARGFAIAGGSVAPRRVRRLGVDVVEAIFAFETQCGRCKGVVRLLPGEQPRAWVLMTSLRELKGHEEPVHARRPGGSAYSREFGGENWADRRAREQAFEDRDPAVLIIGAGQSGLTLAARLRLLGVAALCVDRHERVGDSWRKRYHSLALHNQVDLNQMAYMPFPASWPKYLPKDMLANWLEHYAWALECNVWMRTTFVEGRYDDAAGHWVAVLRRADGSQRVMRPRHIVFANGIVGAPRIPALPGLPEFRGQVLHTHDYQDGAAWKGRDALVLGTGTSGHDIAQDLCSHGANVRIIQRGSTTITSVEAGELVYPLYYKDGLSTEDADLIATSATYALAVRNAQAVTRLQKEADRELLAGLQARGFKLDFGEDETGYVMKVRRIHAGYYLNCGCSDLIVQGKVGLLHFGDIERFVPEGVLMKDGRVEKAELLVAATGYEPQQEVVRQLLGDAVADKVGPIWGIDPADGELRNMYRPTPQKGLWFLGSGMSQARIYTHFVALQIKARELGLVA